MPALTNHFVPSRDSEMFRISHAPFVTCFFVPSIDTR